MNMFENSVTYQFIGNVPKGGDGVPADILNLAEGAVAIVDENNSVFAGGATGGNSVEAAITANARVRIAQKVNGQLVFSPYFNSAVTQVERMDYSEEVPQVTYLGYNGTDGALDAVANTTYTLGVVLQNTQGVLNNTPMIKTIPAFNGGGTQAELALTLKDAFDRIMLKENRKPVVCERVSNGVNGNIAAGAGGNVIRVVKGSTTVTVDGSADGAALAGAGTLDVTADETIFLPTDNGRAFEVTAIADNAHLIVIGDTTLAVGASGSTAEHQAAAIATAINADATLSERVIASNAVAVLTITYRPHFRSLPPVVFENSTNGPLDVTTTLGSNRKTSYIYATTDAAATTFELDRPWQGETGYISTNTGARTNSAGEVAAPTAWGLMFVGRTPNPTQFDTVSETYHPVTFKLSWDRIDAPAGTAADATPITYDTGAQPSRNSFFEIAGREIYTTMNEGNPFISAYPITKYRRAADPTARYRVYVFNALDGNYISPTTGQRPLSKYNIYVAISEAATADLLEFQEFVT